MYPRRRSTVAAQLIITLIGIINIARGAFHYFAVDSGAASIAGFDLSLNGEVIIFLLASIGALQFTYGVWNVFIAFKHKELYIMALGIEVLKNGMALILDYFYKAPPTPIPGRYMHLAVFGLAIIGLITMLVGRYRKRYIFFDYKSL